MRPLVSIFLLIVLAAIAGAQQIGQNTPGSAQTPTFQTSTQLVIETVSVKDKSGKSIDNLTAKDFIITEDGAPQIIRFFEYQSNPAAPRRLPGCRKRKSRPSRPGA
jgi:hypothetical protein